MNPANQKIRNRQNDRIPNRRHIPLFRLGFQMLGTLLTLIGFFNNVPLATTLLIGAAFLMGPVFCGWVCPFGFLQDLASRLGQALRIRKIRMPRAMHLGLVLLRYLLLALLLLVSADFVFTLLSLDPRANWSMFITGYGWSTAAWLVIAAFAVISLFFERPFCRYLCVEGAKFGLFGALRPFSIVRRADTCVHCRKCDRVCPMNIRVSDKPQVRSLQCIDCMNCVAACPVRDTLKLRVATSPKPLGVFLLTLLLIGASTGFVWVAAHNNELALPTATEISATLLSVIDPSTAAVDDISEETEAFVSAYDTTKNTSSTDSSHTSVDGTDTDDSANSNTTQETAAVTTGSPGTTSGTLDDANAATSSTSPSVGAETPDTRTTIAATTNVPSTSETSTASPTTTTPTTTTPATTAPATTSPTTTLPTTTAATTTTHATTAASTAATGNAAGIADGTYAGTGKGFKSTITVKVTVSSQTITNIVLVSENDDQKWFNRAWKSVIGWIISAQSPDVDSVSGATYSSYGIKLAVADALKNAGGTNVDAVGR